MPSFVYKNDEGTKIVLDVGEDITSATTMQIRYYKPNGDFGNWTAYRDTRTTIAYNTKSRDLDIVGEWKIQAYIEMPGWTGLGTTAFLIVRDTFG